MEARFLRAVWLAAVLCICLGARHRTDNFIVDTADPKLAPQIAQAAEKFRHDLAVEWTGEAMPNWAQPCVMTVQVGPGLGAGGATTFVFDHGEVFGWRMSIQGPVERIFDSVLPHEITHMVFASHFRCPLPRWADEGGATSVENISERSKHQVMLNQFLHTGRSIPFNNMFAMKEYPKDIMPLYAEGYALSEFLIQTGGRRKFVDFIGDGLLGKDWPGAVKRNYGYADLGALQTTWLAWVQQGWPQIKPKQDHPAIAPAAELVASAEQRRPRPEPNLLIRVSNPPTTNAGQSQLSSVAPSQISSRGPSQFSSDENGTVPLSSPAPAKPVDLNQNIVDSTLKATLLGPLVPVTPTTDQVASLPGFSDPGVQLAANDSRAQPKSQPDLKWQSPVAPKSSAGAATVAATSAQPAAAASTPPLTDPFRTYVTRPQPSEPPRQTILR
jgi:hypothetical protein